MHEGRSGGGHPSCSCLPRYAAGPGPSLSERLCCWPPGSTTVSVTLSPGRYTMITLCREAAEVTAWPFTAVITSPAWTPAVAAGSLQKTPPIRAPDLAGGLAVGTGAG